MEDMCYDEPRPVWTSFVSLSVRGTHELSQASAQVLEPAGPGRRVGVDKVIHAILRVLRGHNEQVPLAAAASGLAGILWQRAWKSLPLPWRAPSMSVCSEVRKTVPPTSMRIGTCSGMTVAGSFITCYPYRLWCFGRRVVHHVLSPRTQTSHELSTL